MGFRKGISSIVLNDGSNRPRQIGVVKVPGGGRGGGRRAETSEKTAALKKAVQALETILATGLARDPHVAVGDWHGEPTLADLPPDLRDLAAPDPSEFDPAPLGLLERLVPGAGARHAEEAHAAKERFEAAVAEWRRLQARQADALAALKVENHAYNHQLEEREAALRAGDPAMVGWYAGLVLTKSPYPKAVRRQVDAVFDPALKTLNVHVSLPALIDVVPAARGYWFAKQRDEIVELEWPPDERAALYDRVVAQVALRTLHEVFKTDVSQSINACALSVDQLSVDPSTGKDAPSRLMSLRISRQALDDIDLGRVEPVACVEHLKQLTPNAASAAGRGD